MTMTMMRVLMLSVAGPLTTTPGMLARSTHLHRTKSIVTRHRTLALAPAPQVLVLDPSMVVL